MVNRATDQMFEYKDFNLKYTSVLIDAAITLTSYISLIYSVFEIRDTVDEFPFGFADT